VGHGDAAFPGDDPPPDSRERLRRESARVADRLRSISLVRLRAELADGRTRARAGLDSAQELADSCADLTGQVRREIPELPAHAVGDVVAVMVNDLLAELDERGWDAVARQACAEAVAVLVGLRRLL
jgi:hypothetical protein